MRNETCDKCRWWSQEKLPVGNCQRNPPQTFNGKLVWPQTVPEDWCGEWTIIEREAYPLGGNTKPRTIADDT